MPGSYGVQLRATGFGHVYSDVAGTYQTGNFELLLAAGAAQNVPYNGPVVRGRVWNGALRYRTPPGYATFSHYGSGCYDRSAAAYESFATGAFDLAGGPPGPRSIRFQRCS